MRMDLGQQRTACPSAVVVIDAAPRRQILWNIAPLTAGLGDVKNPIEDFQIRVFSGATKVRGFGETVGNEVPFGRGEIRGISHPKVNRGTRTLVQLQNARFVIFQPQSPLFKQALRLVACCGTYQTICSLIQSSLQAAEPLGVNSSKYPARFTY